MKYEEKVHYADISMTMYNQGSSATEITKYLENRNLRSTDIDEVNHSIKTQSTFKFKKEIKAHLLEETLEQNHDNFNELNPELFNKIQQDIAEIKAKCKSKVNCHSHNGKQEQDIIKEVSNSYFSEGEVLQVIGTTVKEQNDKQWKGYRNIFLGVCLTIGVYFIFVKISIGGTGYNFWHSPNF